LPADTPTAVRPRRSSCPKAGSFVSTPQKSGLWTLRELLINGTDRLTYVVKGFGQDRNSEVYVMASKILGPTGTTGTVVKLVPPDTP
jgi:hypothetical protein